MVYFIQAGENGPIKIGTSTVPQIHLDRLQQGNHEELNLVAEIPGERNLEKKVRADLEAFERGRQWFYPTDEVLDYIEKMQLIEYDMVDGVPLAILWRDSEDGETDHCPFVVSDINMKGRMVITKRSVRKRGCLIRENQRIVLS